MLFTLMRRLAVAVFLCMLADGKAIAHRLTVDLEVKLVPNVGAAWVSVPLDNSYTQPVIVCTYNLPNSAAPSATTRIRNVSSSGFELRIQQFENNNTVTANDVHCLISDAGAYTLPNGFKYEAHTVVSDRTSGLSVPNTWSLTNIEEVTAAVTQSYTSPVVLGQVMSFADARASVFWTNNCVNRNNRPYQGNARMCVGKHIGQINSTRASETIGYIVAEAGTGTLNEVPYALSVGADFVAGVGNSPSYTYAVAGDFDIGVTSQNAEDGGQGGWSVLYGADPLPNNGIANAIEEEVVAGDTSRTHTREQVAYWVFRDNQTPTLGAAKTVEVSPVSSSLYALPGADMLYTISVQNTGTGKVDNDSIFIADAIPGAVTLYNGDIDDGGPETGVVIFAQTGSGLSFSEATDLAFSNAATKPATFADCAYTPAAGYDPAVTFICLNPKGSFNDGSFGETSEFSITFRAQVK